MFASKTPRNLNRDPEPFVWRTTKLRTRIKYSDEAIDRDPRPEYDHPQHNEPNPILVYARARRVDGMTYASILWRVNNGGVAGTRAEYDHARRVLTRLARLTEGASA